MGRPELQESVEVGLGATSPVSAGGRLFIATTPDDAARAGRESELAELDPATGTVIRRLRTPRFPQVAVRGDHAWMFGSGTLERIDLAGGATRLLATVSGDDVAVLGERVWVVARDGHLRAFDPSDGRVLDDLTVPEDSYALTAAGGRLWVDAADGVTLVDPRSGAVRRLAGIPSHTAGVGFGSVWSTSFSGRTLTRADPRTGALQARIDMGAETVDAVVAADAVWVATYDGLVRVDPRCDRAVAPVVDETANSGFAAVGRDVWITDSSTRSERRIHLR